MALRVPLKGPSTASFGYKSYCYLAAFSIVFGIFVVAMSTSFTDALSVENPTSFDDFPREDVNGKANLDASPSSADVAPKVFDILGYVLYNERLSGSDMIAYSQDKFFRISNSPKFYRSFTPILFRSSYQTDRNIGRFSVTTFSADFIKVVYAGDVSEGGLPWIKGFFSQKGIDKILFSFNPNGLLSNPVRSD